MENEIEVVVKYAKYNTFVVLLLASIFERQARVFTPPMFMAQEPQMPSLQLLLKSIGH